MQKENELIESILVHNFNESEVDLIQKYRGKPLLIIIYNNQCLGCTGRAIPFTIDELPFPIYLDCGRSVYDQFDSLGTPQWILITKDGLFSRSIFGSQDGAQNRLMYALQQVNEQVN